MAKDDERPQFNPKHRIAGAIILVSLAVIFVPMLLDESTPSTTSQALTEIPTRDAASDTKVVVTQIPTPASEAVKAQVTVADPIDKSTAELPVPAVRTETAKADAVVETKSSVAKAGPVAAVEKKIDSARPRQVSTKRPSAGDKVSKGWIVQVGTFTNRDNAERLRDKLKTNGYAVNAESVTLHGSNATRLRVGPFAEKAAAAKAQTQLQKDLNIQGVVLVYP